MACDRQVRAGVGRDVLSGGGEKAETEEAAGLHLRISPVKVSMGIRASRSRAVSSQIWFCAASCKRRLRRPVVWVVNAGQSARDLAGGALTGTEVFGEPEQSTLVGGWVEFLAVKSGALC